MATSSISTNSSNNSYLHLQDEEVEEDDCFFADAQLDLEDALQEEEEDQKERNVSNKKEMNNSGNSSNNSLSSVSDNDDNKKQQKQKQKQKNRSSSSQNSNKILKSTKTATTSMETKHPFASIPPRNKPKRPRDIQWGVFYVILIILSLFVSHLILPSNIKTIPNIKGLKKSDITHSALIFMSKSKIAYGYTFLSTMLVYVVCVICARHLYRTQPGGDGDDVRHHMAVYIDKCTVVSVMGLPLFVFLILGYTPKAWKFAIVPIFVLVRDVFVFRDRLMSSGPWGALGDTDGRRTFFRELMCMSLDIISRSIRSRNQLQRYIQCMLLLQCILLISIRHIIFRLLSQKAMFTAFVVLVGGKWTCSIIIRQLGFIASGCIISWFLQMNEVVEEQPQQNIINSTNIHDNNNEGLDSDSASDDYNVGYNIYNYKENPYYPQTLLQHEDEDEYHDSVEMTISPEQQQREQQEADVYSNFAPLSSLKNVTNKNNASMHWSNNYTLSSLVISSWTISFGSIVQCALSGWITQFLWSCIRNLERMSFVRTIQRRSKVPSRRLLSASQDEEEEDDNGEDGFFETMEVSASSDYYNEIVGSTWHKLHYYIYVYILSKYSDFGLCHVAAYYKCYTRSAQDVMNVIHSSGIEPIIHDDITTAMLTSFCSAVSNVIVLLLSFLLVHHRTTTLVNYDHSNILVLSDTAICTIMLSCYIMSFILLQTLMEIIRSSIKTVYVCFAQFPSSLQNSFPLIYHRLMRISSSNNNFVESRRHS